jgi:hypothetical protein
MAVESILDKKDKPLRDMCNGGLVSPFEPLLSAKDGLLFEGKGANGRTKGWCTDLNNWLDYW